MMMPLDKNLPVLSSEHKMYALSGLANCGLTFADCVCFFAREQMDDPDLVILACKAKHDFEQEGELEFDDNPIVSAPDDEEAEGAYVMAWRWVYK
jgi:hypothetical protein